MKKLLAIVALVLLMVTMLTACSSKVKCAICQQEKPGSTIEYMGEEVDVCDDCQEGLEAVEDALEGLEDLM